jgi:hypothetical protein
MRFFQSTLTDGAHVSGKSALVEVGGFCYEELDAWFRGKGRGSGGREGKGNGREVE